MELRDVLVILNILAMVGGAFYLVGMLRVNIQHLAHAIEHLNQWLSKVDSKLDKVSEKVAALEAHRKDLLHEAQGQA